MVEDAELTTENGATNTFTLVDDRAASELGWMAAGVFSVVLRHQRMRQRVCRASIERMASLLGVHRHTIVRHLRQLVEAGYLRDLTPDINWKPHHYMLTARGWALVEAVNDGDEQDRIVAELVSGQEGVPDCNTLETPEGDKNLPGVPDCNTQVSQIGTPRCSRLVQGVSQDGTQGPLLSTTFLGPQFKDRQADAAPKARAAQGAALSSQDSDSEILSAPENGNGDGSRPLEVGPDRSFNGGREKEAEPDPEPRHVEDPDKLFASVSNLVTDVCQRADFDAVIAECGYGAICNAVTRELGRTPRTWGSIKRRAERG